MPYTSLEDIYANYVLRDYKRNAARDGRTFTLTFEQFKETIFSDCYYCGAKPQGQRVRKHWDLSKMPKHNGIDRLDNDEGYAPENVVACCWICNQMKSSMSEQEFIAHISRIVSRLV